MRKHFEAEQKALSDQLFIAQAEARLAKDQLERAIEARAQAERISVKLLTQFGTVAMIFEEAKALAEEVTRDQQPLLSDATKFLESLQEQTQEPDDA
jgi:translation initiation factor 2 alpha subunit (eIF-2alpha)